MNEKELDKSLNKTVKPGTEQIALNTAQTQANQLLTEQTMNLQAERQVMTSNSERDVELRGAIELGAMNEAQPQPQPQVQALPPQAAGLRPETQQLLAKYGVNPNITESAKTTSNSSQTRTANNKMQVIPNKQGGETRVTNTTNITNITNNNSRVETKVDMPKQPAVLPPGPPARLAPVAVGATAGMAAMASHNKFKTFLNNLFAKRDHERQLQEREFRRRDWSIQRMSRKVMERMNSISEKFASKMNPEKIGSTFTSQIKLFLSMVGLTLLPKVWPSIIKGIDGISGFLSDIKTAWTSEDGGVIKKLSAVGSTIVEKLTNGIMSIGGTIVGGITGLADNIAAKLTDVLAGTDYDEVEKKTKGLIGVLGDRLVEFFGGDRTKTTFPQMLENYFSTLFGSIKDYLGLLADDRAEAISDVWQRNENNGWFGITKLVNNLPELLAAAIGGHRGLANYHGQKPKAEAKEELNKYVSSENKDILGRVNTTAGANQVARGLQEMAGDNEKSNSTAVYEGLDQLRKLGLDNNLHGQDFHLTGALIENLINKLQHVSPDPENYRRYVYAAINDAIDDGLIYTKRHITGPNGGGVINERAEKLDYEGKGNRTKSYLIDMKYLPQLVGVLSGQLTEISSDPDKLSENNEIVRQIGDSSYKLMRSVTLDKALTKLNPEIKSEYAKMHAFEDLADGFEYLRGEQLNRIGKATEVEWFIDNKLGFLKGLTPSSEAWNKFDEGYFRGYVTTRNGNPLVTTANAVVDTAKDVYNTVTGSKVAGKVGDFVDHALEGANFGSNPYYGQQAQVPLALPESNSNPTTYPQYNWNQGTYNQVPVEVNQPPVTAWSDVDESVTDAPSAAVAESREKRDEFKGEIKRNNPGNIRPNSLKGFNTYSSLDDGFSAMFNKLIRWFQSAPKSERAVQLGVAGKPANTINEFIRVWAPASDNNNEENYVRFVEDYTGIGRDYRIDPRNESDMKAIVEAMTIMEHTGGKKLTEGMLASLDKGWENRTAEVKAVNVDAPANQTLYAEGNPTDQKSSSDNINGLLASLGDMGGYFEDLITQDDIDLLYGTPSTSTMTAARIDSPSDDLVTSNIVSASYPTMPSAKMDAVKIDDTIEPEAVETESVADVVPPAIMDNSTHHSDNSQTIINNNIILDSGKDLFTERRTLGFSLA